MYMGGLGTTTIGNVFSFKGYDIVSSGINDTINLFNNITTGIVNFCNGLTSTGTLQIGGAKLRHGNTNFFGYSRFLEIASTNTVPTPIDLNYYILGGILIICRVEDRIWSFRNIIETVKATTNV